MNINTFEKTNYLKQIGILQTLTQSDFEVLSAASEFKMYEKGIFVYKENQSSSKVYFVVSGKVKLASNIESGKTLIKDIIHSNNIFGENIFQEHSVRSEYAETLESENLIVSVDKSTILALVNKNEAFSFSLMQLIMQRMNNLEQRMKNFIFLKAKSRISEFIGRMGLQRGVKIGMDEWLINHGLSHKEIAYMTDTSRQTVARVLGELKKENLIHFSTRKPSKILIRNIDALQNLAV